MKTTWIAPIIYKVLGIKNAAGTTINPATDESLQTWSSIFLQSFSRKSRRSSQTSMKAQLGRSKQLRMPTRSFLRDLERILQPISRTRSEMTNHRLTQSSNRLCFELPVNSPRRSLILLLSKKNNDHTSYRGNAIISIPASKGCNTTSTILVGFSSQNL